MKFEGRHVFGSKNNIFPIIIPPVSCDKPVFFLKLLINLGTRIGGKDLKSKCPDVIFKDEL